MRGMERSLRARVIDAVEFEYTRAWKPHLGEHALKDHLAWLDSVGYTCFWQGNRGALAQISAGCYQEETRNRFGFARGNAVCTHRADAIAVLDGIAQEGEARRRRECTRSGASFANGKRMTRSDAKAWCGPRWKPAVASA